MIIKRFAVIGNPIKHSLSPIIHQHFAHQTHVALRYELLQGNEEQFEQQVSDFFAQGGAGLNVTLPFKRRAFAMAQECSLRCQIAVSTNTLWLQKGRLNADNTDGIGLIRDLTRYIALKEKNILILGCGGATRGIIHPLLAMNPAALTVANRTIKKAVALQHDIPQIKCTALGDVSGVFDLIINATSASLTGKTVSLPKHIMSQQPVCYDLAYQQEGDTPFVAYAKTWGCEAIDGLGMLVEQAAEAFFIWNGVMPETESVLKLMRAFPKQKMQ